MNEAQKIIKYCALALAAFLVFGIISGIVAGIGLVLRLGSFADKKEDIQNQTFEVASKVANLKIDVSSAEVVIETGEEFLIETNNQYIGVRQKNKTVTIEEKEYSILKHKFHTKLYVTVPDDFTFEFVEIDTGAGKLDIEALMTNRLDLDLGAGRVSIEKLNVYDEVSVDGGAGEIEIKGGELHNLDLDMGVGRVSITSKIIGNSEIDAGIGEVEFYLLGSFSDYCFEIDKGIGEIIINDEKMADDTVYGTGNYKFTLNGGVGSIQIITSEGNTIE